MDISIQRKDNEMAKELYETNDIPTFKAEKGTTFSVMHPTDRSRVTGVGRVVDVKEKNYPGAKVVFELIKGFFVDKDGK